MKKRNQQTRGVLKLKKNLVEHRIEGGRTKFAVEFEILKVLFGES